MAAQDLQERAADCVMRSHAQIRVAPAPAPPCSLPAEIDSHLKVSSLFQSESKWR